MGQMAPQAPACMAATRLRVMPVKQQKSSPVSSTNSFISLHVGDGLLGPDDPVDLRDARDGPEASLKPVLAGKL